MNNKIEIIFPSGALGESAGDTKLESMLREISKKFGEDEEWPEKYGTNIDTDIFKMHRFCWCEKPTCPYCWDEEKNGKIFPNFIYKPKNLKVWWYKYIGRSMEVNMELSDNEIQQILNNCLHSDKLILSQESIF